MYIVYSIDQRDYSEQAVGLFPTYYAAYSYVVDTLEPRLDDFHTPEIRSRDGRFI